MGHYTLKRLQNMPLSLDQAWDFFSSPQNLKLITPAYMNFKVLSYSDSDKIFAGQIITYKVSPIMGIPLSWMTEITHVKDKEYFVDEQRRGPYAMWHHKHFFKSIPGGVEMTDLLDYKLPLGILGNIAHELFVKRQIESIFDYRQKVLEERFGKYRLLTGF